MATGTAIGLGLTGVAPAQAADFAYSWKGNSGYSATGSFSYSGTSVPASISEIGSGPTSFLNSLSLSVFNPSNNLLDSGSSVANGVSGDPFLMFKFNTLTQNDETYISCWIARDHSDYH